MNNKQKQSVNGKDINYNRKYLGRLIFFVVIAIFTLFTGRFFYVSVFHKADGQNLQKKLLSYMTLKQDNLQNVERFMILMLSR
jgi:hypothetical protein